DNLAVELGIRSVMPSKYSYSLFAHLLLSGKCRTRHYGTLKNKFYYYHHQARRAMFAVATLVFSVSFLLSLSQAIDGFLLSMQRDSLIDESRKYVSLYEEVVSDIGKMDLDVGDIRDAVTAAEKLETFYRATPFEFMQRVSRSLQRNPNIEITNIDWMQSGEPNHSFVQTRTPGERSTGRRGRDTKVLRYETAQIEANITGYNNNPRIAVENVNRFLDELRRNHSDGRVEVLKMPFDVDPSSRMVGQGSGVPGSQANDKASFVFVLMREYEVQ
ncbi:MAG TPA: hypothetical protein VF268_16130, partial [Gammaproteobacteria bacterium]